MTIQDHSPSTPLQRGRVPSGLRRLTPAGIETDQLAKNFAGDDTTTAGQVLAALKAAAPFLRIAPRLVHAIDWLFQFTQPQDWQPNRRPIVWPSARLQQDSLDLSESQVRRLNRALIEHGFIAMRDSPNGKRYGRRDPKGNITEAYGFDLSPIATRLDELRALAADGRAARAEAAALRRRATIARNSLRQTRETRVEHQIDGPEWTAIEIKATAASRAMRGLDGNAALTVAVTRLETIAATARSGLEMSLASGTAGVQDSVDMRPRGRTDAPHITTTTENLNPYGNTVMALDRCSLDQSSRQAAPIGRRDSGTVMKITPDNLVRLAPRLRLYLRRSSPSWPEIVDAADWLRHDLGISKPLWGDACLAMGREHAAIAVAIVSAKPPEHFKSTPGGYFNGMVKKSRAGELNLSRTLWAMNDTTPPKPR